MVLRSNSALQVGQIPCETGVLSAESTRTSLHQAQIVYIFILMREHYLCQDHAMQRMVNAMH